MEVMPLVSPPGALGLDMQLARKIQHVYRIYNGRLYPFFEEDEGADTDIVHFAPPSGVVVRFSPGTTQINRYRAKAKLKVSPKS